jgi:hypothetical protein
MAETLKTYYGSTQIYDSIDSGKCADDMVINLSGITYNADAIYWCAPNGTLYLVWKQPYYVNDKIYYGYAANEYLLEFLNATTEQERQAALEKIMESE